MFGKVIFVVILSSYVSARSIDKENENVREGRVYIESKNSFLSDLKHVYRVYEECASKELGPCLKIKFITALDRLSRKIELPIIEGISLIKDEKLDNGNEMDNEVLEATLPRSLEEKDVKLDEIIVDKIVNFFSSRSLQFKLSGIKALQRSFQDVEDGRGKKGKYNSLMLIPLMMGGSMIPMALGTLALLAGKALIIAKLALTLSLIIGLKKLLSHDDHGSYQVVSHGGGHYRRSLQDDEAAQAAAYRAYIPLTPESSTSQYSS
ncbi:hypothetical protein PGB90_005674 [Kerria lacca]